MKSMHITRRRSLAAVAGLLLACGSMAAEDGQRASTLVDDRLPAQPGARSAQGSVVRFASPAEGRRLIAAQDEWTAATSDFHRGATMGVPPPVPLPRFLAHLAAAVLPWTDEAAELWQQALPAALRALDRWGVKLPPQVLLVHTDGRDSANAPYTRGAAIFLPAAVDLQGYSPLELLVHELVHVASRHDTGWATRLYAVFGFRPVGELQWPAAWQAVRIANPDAPHARHALRVNLPEGRQADVMPLLVARTTELPLGQSFFDVMEVRLLEVQAVPDQPTQPVLRQGEPRWHRLLAVPDYLRQLGGNTSYVIHPEETLADNLAFLASGRKVHNPALLKKLEAALLGR